MTLGLSETNERRKIPAVAKRSSVHTWRSNGLYRYEVVPLLDALAMAYLKDERECVWEEPVPDLMTRRAKRKEQKRSVCVCVDAQCDERRGSWRKRQPLPVDSQSRSSRGVGQAESGVRVKKGEGTSQEEAAEERRASMLVDEEGGRMCRCERAALPPSLIVFGNPKRGERGKKSQVSIPNRDPQARRNK